MKTSASCIVFEFDTNCPQCGSTERTPVRMTVRDIMEIGEPPCSNCGQKMAMKDTCEVRSKKHPFHSKERKYITEPYKNKRW